MPVARLAATAISVAAVVVLAGYPLLVYAGIGRFGARGVAVLLAVACVLRLVVLRRRGQGLLRAGHLVLLCGGGVLLAAASFVLGSEAAVRYYPVLVNGVLLVVFAASLASPPTVIERIARLRDPELPPAAVAYTRRVTIAWTVFFAINGAIALYTAAFAPLTTWALYNGLIAYVLVAVMMAGELAIRFFVKARLRE
ncbi:MAG TPA: hypothetical protein VKA43_13915 [Gammaproteobacteria bacterium]|nr:hypothetical protein [Gammaproteobacteria bacterium]